MFVLNEEHHVIRKKINEFFSCSRFSTVTDTDYGGFPARYNHGGTGS